MDTSLHQDISSSSGKGLFEHGDQDLLGDFDGSSKLDKPLPTVEGKTISPEPEDKKITPELISVTPEPKSVTPEPKSVTPEPKSVTPEPKSIASEPDEVSQERNVPSPESLPLTPEPKRVTPDPQPAANRNELLDSLEPPLKTDSQTEIGSGALGFSVSNGHDFMGSKIEPLEDSVLKTSGKTDPFDFQDELESHKAGGNLNFGFDKPLPPEPVQAVSDFLKAETTHSPAHISDEKDDDVAEFVGASGDSPSLPLSREESPIPPPVPKHQNIRDDSPERFESSPEPDFKPMDSVKHVENIEPPKPAVENPPPKKPEDPKPSPPKPVESSPFREIGAKNLIVEIDAWFNPARLHPQVESLVYWRDPKKSGVVFGVILITLLSLTAFSLISVLAYLGLLTLTGTIAFRVYKNIMQAVQKTSDGHPFKDLLDVDISLPEDKVVELSRAAAGHVNSALSFLRSLFLVEDLIDSIKGLVLFWALTYLGAIFNGLTLLIIGVILLFSLPRLYEQNKAQVDAYVQIGMDKLSILTSRMKAAIPSSAKKEEKKDQ